MRSIPKTAPVLFVSSNFPPVVGGSAVVYDQLCKNAGGEIIALSASRDYRTGELWPNFAAADRQRGYPIYRLPFLRPPIFETDATGLLHRVARVLTRDLPVMARLLGYILVLTSRHNCKVICLGELVYGGWLVFPLRYIFRLKVLIYTHGEEISQNAENFLSYRRGTFLRHANGVIAVSLFCKGQIIAKYQIDPRKIFVINNGVDLEAFNCSSENRGIWPNTIRNKRIILSVSRLVERKGHETLIRAMPAVLKRHPDAHCVIVGGGPLEGRLRMVAKEVGVSEQCTVIGPAPQADVIEYFRNCDVFALPCHTLPDGDTEGFGLVFLEAGACRKPVIAGVAGGTVEAVAHGETGLLVDGTSPPDVAMALDRILSDPAFAQGLADEAWRRSRALGWRQVTQKFLDVCRSPPLQSLETSYTSSRMHEALPRSAGGKVIPRLLVTVDVEEEFAWEEFDRARHRVRGSEALEQFHADCRSVGVSPVYLLTYPILMDENYRPFLKRAIANREAELGIHLHSWTVPPYWEQANVFTSYQCNLPENIERSKLETLCRVFEECFGQPVRIHRAGRWGGGERTSALLETLGISVDLSPSAGYSDVGVGGPDFRNLDGAPFWSGDQRKVLTVPASSVNYLRGPRWLSSAAFGSTRNWPSVRARMQKRGTPVRFSPENADEATLFAMAHELGMRALPTAIYTLHSTSLYSSGNPYSIGEGDALALRRRSVNFLGGAIEAKLLRPTTCAKLFNLAQAQVERPGGVK
jgi:glycosyltransferase involved in cell wall biosynthesis